MVDPTESARGTGAAADEWPLAKLLSALADCNDEDLISIFDSVCLARPHLCDRIATTAQLERTPRSGGSKAPLATSTVATHQKPDFSHSQALPIVQFSTYVHYCTEEEDEGCLTIDVLRIGNTTGRSEVCYATKDGTAKSGERYVAVTGTVVFEAGEDEKSIKIPILSSDEFMTTVEFKVGLSNDGLVGATLDDYLSNCRAYVIDCTPFPSTKYEERIRERKGFHGSKLKWGLLLEYFKMNMRNPVVRRGTRKILIIDLLHNLNFLLDLILQVYLLDYVIHSKIPDEDLILPDHKACLWAIVGIRVACSLFLHVLDYAKLSWKVGGTSRAILQKALLIQFLNVDELSRLELNGGNMILNMTRHTNSIVHDAFMRSMNLIKQLERLLMIVIFQLVTPALFDKDSAKTIYIALVLFPLVLMTFVHLRRHRTNTMQDTRNDKLEHLIDHVSKVVHMCPLLRDFKAHHTVREIFLDPFETKIKEYNGAVAALNKIDKNNEYFSLLLSILFVGLYTIIGGMEVIDAGETGVGLFVVNLKVMGQIGHATGGIYSTILCVQSTFASLTRMVEILNLKVDLPDRREVRQECREVARVRRAALPKGDAYYRVDHLPIIAQNITFSYPMKVEVPATKNYKLIYREVNCAGTFEMQQGQLAAITGPIAEGKATFLKILGDTLLPTTYRNDNQSFFIPLHLRTLHVPEEPLFFQGSLMENLTFGVGRTNAARDGNPERIKKICGMLGMDHETMAYLDKTDERHYWGDVLSEAQCRLLNIARALISNSEIMCIHKPGESLDDFHKQKVFDVLRAFVDNKGLLQDTPWHSRRPRTCIVSTTSPLGLRQCDQVFHISKQYGIVKTTAEDSLRELGAAVKHRFVTL